MHGLNILHLMSFILTLFFSVFIMQHTSRRLHYALNPVHSSCAHWLASASATQRHPTWLTCIPVSAMSGRTHLRSTIHCDLVVPRTCLARCGPRSFAVSGPVTWNSLPPDLRDMSLSAASFFNQLETELFIRAYYMRS